MRQLSVLLFSLLAILSYVQSFQLRVPQFNRCNRASTLKLNSAAAPEFILEPVQNYVQVWTPLFTKFQEAGLLPDALAHWGHGAGTL